MWLLRAGALLVGIAILGAACSSGSTHDASRSTSSTVGGITTTTVPTPPAPTVPIQRFSAGTGNGLSFDYPRAWRGVRYDVSSSFGDLITYLTNVDIHDPCTRSVSSSGMTIRCSNPVKLLHPGGVLISWSNLGSPHPASEPEVAHPNTTVGARPARLEIRKPGTCDHIGADETITVDIERPGGNHYEMVACLGGPELARNERLVKQMLASARVTA